MPERVLAIVDTNVLITANGRGHMVPATCSESCIDSLLDIRDRNSLVLDEHGKILEEYASHCNHSGQPGVGDEFFRWAFQSQYTSCRRVVLTPDDDRGYREFPDAPELSKFDRSDRKFVATALSCDLAAEILNAVDSDYAQFADALKDAGVTVIELCPDCLKHAG